MGTITTKDGVQIFYKDWGQGQPIVFHHGWPLSSDDWDTQMLFFVQHGLSRRSVSTGAATDARARCRTATTWTTTPPTRPRSSNIWICATLFILATPPVAAK